MPYVERAALNRKISETQEAIVEANKIENESLRMIMSSELEVRLSELLKESESIEAASSKETVALRIYGEKVQPGKVSSRVLLAALSGFQSMVDSVANAMLHSPTARGKIPETIKDMTSFEVVGTFAGSFGITLERQNMQCGLSGSSPELTCVLDEVFNVLEITDNSELLMSTIAPLGKRTVGHYRQWLDELKENEVNLELNWTDNAANKRSMQIVKEKAPSIISTLDAIDKIDQDEVVLKGVLNGVNLRNHTFEMSVDGVGLIKGNSKIETLIAASYKLGSTVNAHLIRSTSITKTGFQKLSWYLSCID